MKKINDNLQQVEELLLGIFKVLSFSMAISVVLLVEAWGITKVWAIVTAS